MPGEFLKHSGHFLKHRGTEARRKGRGWRWGKEGLSVVSVALCFYFGRGQCGGWKHGGTEARSISAQWVSLREEDRVTENEVANWTDASLFALLS